MLNILILKKFLEWKSFKILVSKGQENSFFSFDNFELIHEVTFNRYYPNK